MLAINFEFIVNDCAGISTVLNLMPQTCGDRVSCQPSTDMPQTCGDRFMNFSHVSKDRGLLPLRFSNRINCDGYK